MKDGKFNGGNPAYPVATNDTIYAGLTKRELFAAMAMQGLLGNEGCLRKFKNTLGIIDSAIDIEVVSKTSVVMADALLAELEKTK